MAWLKFMDEFNAVILLIEAVLSVEEGGGNCIPSLQLKICSRRLGNPLKQFLGCHRGLKGEGGGRTSNNSLLHTDGLHP